jgi:uncharacterized protein
MAQNTGYFVWHDLMTTDLDAALAFYPELFGWSITEIAMGSFTYRRIDLGGGGQGAFMPLDPDHGLPSHWMPYLAVADVDAVVEGVEELGGKRCVPPMDMPNVGRFAVIEDPAGTPFTAFKGTGEARDLSNRNHHGQFCWDDLAVPDPEAALAFYQEVVGWQVETSTSGMGPYHVVSPAGTTGPGKGIGGVMQRPPSEERPMWTPYIYVDEIEPMVARAVELGAELQMGPYDAGEVGVMAFLNDPTGARFAMFQSPR